MTRVVITIDRGGHKELYSRVSEERFVLPLLFAAVNSAVAAHASEITAIAAMFQQLHSAIAAAGLLADETTESRAGVSKLDVRSSTGKGGPCETCGQPRNRHVCISCSPTGDEPGPGCGNCRQTGWDQTPCLPPHRWVRHGWPCCDLAPAERPPWAQAIAKCGGPGLCAVCKQEVAAMAGHLEVATNG